MQSEQSTTTAPTKVPPQNRTASQNVPYCRIRLSSNHVRSQCEDVTADIKKKLIRLQEHSFSCWPSSFIWDAHYRHLNRFWTRIIIPTIVQIPTTQRVQNASDPLSRTSLLHFSRLLLRTRKSEFVGHNFGTFCITRPSPPWTRKQLSRRKNNDIKTVKKRNVAENAFVGTKINQLVTIECLWEAPLLADTARSCALSDIQSNNDSQMARLTC